MLWGPLTGLEAKQETIEGSCRYLDFCPTVNRSAIVIEELVDQRRLLQLQCTDLLTAELKGGHTPNRLLTQIEKHADVLRHADATVFNDDEQYKVVLENTVNLKAGLEAAAGALA